MAVRHLKRYVSWVQTVQQLALSRRRLDRGRVIERFESRGTNKNSLRKIKLLTTRKIRQFTAAHYRNVV
jgi:hypothetical protein